MVHLALRVNFVWLYKGAPFSSFWHKSVITVLNLFTGKIHHAPGREPNTHKKKKRKKFYIKTESCKYNNWYSLYLMEKWMRLLRCLNLNLNWGLIWIWILNTRSSTLRPPGGRLCLKVIGDLPQLFLQLKLVLQILLLIWGYDIGPQPFCNQCFHQRIMILLY